MTDRFEPAAVILLGYLMDLVFGDPRLLYHPVRLIGRMISITERVIRRFCGKNENALLAGGFFLVVFVLLETFIFFGGILWAAARISPQARFLVSVLLCWMLLAVRSLKTESMKVYEKLKKGTLPEARAAVSMIVGRDTERLTAEQVAKAAVETVAENTSDGITAPLFYLALGGPLLGFLYKAVNTMDSMVGYKNDRYLYFGRAAARTDDLLNFLPSRIAAVFMTAAAFVCRYDFRQAWRIFRRDRFCHASPNSAQTESVCAGALGVQLAGDAWYFGKKYEKPFIGDPGRPVTAEDIKRACRLMYVTAFFSAVSAAAVRLLIVFLWEVAVS